MLGVHVSKVGPLLGALTALVTFASTARADDAVVADAPEVAVRQLVAKEIDGAHLQLGPGAFGGLPEPTKGIVYRARRSGVDEAGFRIAVIVEALYQSRVLGRRRFVFPWTLEEQVVVPKRMIRVGETLGSDDLHVVTLELDGRSSAHALSLDELVGRVAKRNLLPDAPVPLRSIERPAVVERGDHIRVRVSIGRMEIIMKGEALDSGAVGDTVRVVNPSSKKTLSGRAVDFGLVEVFQ